MKKYLLIDKNGESEMNEEEMTNFFFFELFQHFQKNIETDFNKKKNNIVFNEYRKNYKYRPKKSDKCLHLGCNNIPIYSHSISELAVLKNIATNDGFVYAITNNKNKIMKKIGIHKQASVFPGFCEEHDRTLFKRIDNPKNKIFDKEFYSQLMLRTISREIYVRNRKIYYKDKLINKLKEEHNCSVKKFFEEFNKTLNTNRLSFENIESNSFDIHFAVNKLTKEIEKAKFFLKKLDSDFLLNTPFGQGMVVKQTLPIAFSGLCNFDNLGSFLLINCLPYKELTTISLFYSKKDKNKIEKYLSKYDLEDENSVLKLIEKLAVRGTDNIFFNVEYWDTLNKTIANKFLFDFMDIDCSNIQNEIDYSFLNWNQ